MADEAIGADSADYTVFGLRVRSSLPLPELFPATGCGEADVLIDSGGIEAPESTPGLTVANDGLLLTVPEVGRFLISDGRSIRAEPMNGVDPRNVRLFLLGSAFGVLLHQRGLLPLHANAIEVDSNAFAFSGASGAGKSTLAAWFHDRGFRLVADDVCVVRFDSHGKAQACPGLPRLRLWLDALEKTGRASAGLHRSYAGSAAGLDKFDVPLGWETMRSENIPLRAVYLLDEGESFAISRLRGVEAAQVIFENTYRGSYLAAANAHRMHWQSAVRLAQHTPVFRIARSMRTDRFESECERLLEHLSSEFSLGATAPTRGG